MTLSAIVEIHRPFDGAQGMLQAKRNSVMPANAGVQGDGKRGKGTKTEFPPSRE
jgi:hypothetical protein